MKILKIIFISLSLCTSSGEQEIDIETIDLKNTNDNYDFDQSLSDDDILIIDEKLSEDSIISNKHEKRGVNTEENAFDKILNNSTQINESLINTISCRMSENKMIYNKKDTIKLKDKICKKSSLSRIINKPSSIIKNVNKYKKLIKNTAKEDNKKNYRARNIASFKKFKFQENQYNNLIEELNLFIQKESFYKNSYYILEIVGKVREIYLLYKYLQPDKINEFFKFVELIENNIVKSNVEIKIYLFHFTKKLAELDIFMRMPTYHLKYCRYLIGFEHFWKNVYTVEGIKKHKILSNFFVTKYLCDYLLEEKSNLNFSVDLFIHREFNRKIKEFIFHFFDGLKLGLYYANLWTILYHVDCIFTENDIILAVNQANRDDLVLSKAKNIFNMVKNLIFYFPQSLFNSLQLNKPLLCTNPDCKEIIKLYSLIAVQFNKILLNKTKDLSELKIIFNIFQKLFNDLTNEKYKYDINIYKNIRYYSLMNYDVLFQKKQDWHQICDDYNNIIDKAVYYLS
ncbi:hypothetical protein TCON_0407 [Astathelohania contejeani]|uniref:Uncharacterized protein n=1 Tax=Astathelohania contejeani TaxID=164912 RepID=A0ABQ7I1N9_9MICR|nr:hypothetical protein TCON_0407 [Thelohania contejeani]